LYIVSFSEPNSCTATVLGDELDPSIFKRFSDRFNGTLAGDTLPLFEINQRCARNPGSLGNVSLLKIQHGARSSALFWGHLKSDLKSDIKSDMVSDINSIRRP
jgi:hypothetical protein